MNCSGQGIYDPCDEDNDHGTQLDVEETKLSCSCFLAAEESLDADALEGSPSMGGVCIMFRLGWSKGRTGRASDKSRQDMEWENISQPNTHIEIPQMPWFD